MRGVRGGAASFAIAAGSVFLACGESADAPTRASDGGDAAPEASGSPSPSSTIAISTCDGDASATLGAGYAALGPRDCLTPSGPTNAATAPSDVAALLAGTWVSCGVPPFGIEMGTVPGTPIELGRGAELTSDGRYFGLGQSADWSFARVDTMPGSVRAADGTFDVLDGSATYGPGTFALRLRAADGNVTTGQLTVTDSPRQIHFQGPSGPAQVLAPALPLRFRAGVCSCVHTDATKLAETDPAALASLMTGRWLWCGGDGSPMNAFLDSPAVGFEVVDGRSWYALEESADGTVSRASATDAHTVGTFDFVPTASLRPSDRWTVQEPYALVLHGARGDMVTTAIVTENPRALVLGIGNGVRTGPDGGSVPFTFYSVLFPMP